MKYASIYAGLFTAGALLTGGFHAKYHGRPIWVVIIIYLLGGLFVGCCVDLLKAVTTARWQASLFGVFVAAPLAFGVNLVFLPHLSLRVMALATAVAAVVYGGLYGASPLDPPDERRPAPPGFS